MAVDQCGTLEQEPFTWKQAKDGKIFLFWNGKQVKTLPAREAEGFLKKLEGLDSHGRQLVMAKLTGNFKRGNEKEGKRR